MNRILVGFAGPIGSGKDTMAHATAEAMSGTVMKFADPLYAMAKQVDPAFHPSMTHVEKNEWLLGNPELGTRRDFLQKLGTEFGRCMIHNSLWTLIQEARLELTSKPVFYSDVRFPNEADWIRRMGGHIIHLRCNWVRPTTDEANAHISEKPLPFVQGDSIIGLSKGQIQKGAREVLGIIEDIFLIPKASKLG